MTTSETMDTIEDTLDVLESIPTVVKKNKAPIIIMMGIAIGGAAVISGVICWKIAKKRSSNTIEARIEEELNRAKEFYARKYKTENFATPEDAAAVLIPVTEVVEEGITGVTRRHEVEKAIKTYHGIPPSDDDVDSPDSEVVVLETRTVRPAKSALIGFVPDPPREVFDYEEEEVKRAANPNDPFIIHIDEYNKAELDYNNVTLTYFAEDGVLTDEKDQPIDDIDDVVGDDNLTRFGYGADDSRVVYIRNNRLQIDFEVVKSEGSYVKEILGFTEEDLRHSHRRPLRSMRGTDE